MAEIIKGHVVIDTTLHYEYITLRKFDNMYNMDLSNGLYYDYWEHENHLSIFQNPQFLSQFSFSMLFPSGCRCQAWTSTSDGPLERSVVKSQANGVVIFRK